MSAQSGINVINFSHDEFPLVQSKVFLYNGDSIPSSSFLHSDIKVFDNGTEIENPDIHIEPSQTDYEASIIVSYDLSVDTANRKKALQYMRTLINSLNYNQTECALTAFDDMNYLFNDFSTDKELLLSSIAQFPKKAGSDIQNAMNMLPGGYINIADRAKFKKWVVLVTDGYLSVNSAELIRMAQENDISFLIAVINSEVHPSLRALAVNTEGFVLNDFQNSSPDILAYTTKNLIYKYTPVTVYWQTRAFCSDEHNIIMTFQDTLTAGFQFTDYYEEMPILVSQPPYLGFKAVLPGTNRSLNLMLKAENNDVEIYNFSIGHPAFRITYGDVTADKLVIPQGESRDLTIEFTPEDSSIIFTSLKIESNACGLDSLLITGGFPNQKPNPPTLQLISPKCGETLIIGDTAEIIWTGLLPSDVVQLEYSLDNGDNWDTLRYDVDGLYYRWPVPDSPTDECLIRIFQLWPNNIGETMDFQHEAAVNSAIFNRFSDRVVTASKDKSARIWNSNSGEQVIRFDGHSAAVNWANYNPEETLVVTAGADETAIVWNANTAKQIHTLSGHNDNVTSANFSPDGTEIVTSGWDGTARIWDAASGEEKDVIGCGQGRLWHAKYSPDGKYILTAGSTGILKLWSADDHSPVRSYITDVNMVVYADFSPRMDKIVGASWYGKAYIFDLESADTLYSVTHMSDTTSSNIPLNSAEFFIIDNNLYLITSGIDNARIWNGEDGSFIKSMEEHTKGVQTARFNFDGSRVVTSSWDSTAKVWNLDKFDLQMDLPRCKFNIGYVDIDIPDLNIGQVPLGSVKDSVFSSYIKNNSGFGMKIESIEIISGDTTEFQIIQGYKPFILDTLNNNLIEIRFAAKTLGNRQATVEITYPSGSETFDIIADVYQPNFEIPINIIDFAQVDLGDYKDTVISVTFKNNTPDPIRIDSIYKDYPDISSFEIISGIETFPVNMTAFEEKSMTFRYSPDDIKRNNGLVRILHSKPPYDGKIYLFGEGYFPHIDTVTLKIENASGKPGDIIAVPLTIHNIGNSGIDESIKGFHFDLSFNSTLLEPLNMEFEKTYKGDNCILKAFAPATIGADSTLATFSFRVGLGNDTLTELKIEHAYPSGNGKILINEESGMFTLEGLCREGGVRLFESDGRISLSQNKPNPFNNTTDIEFSIIEPGRTSLKVVDITGKVVAILEDKSLPPGKYTYKFHAAELPSGIYYYILQTPTERFSKIMTVDK